MVRLLVMPMLVLLSWGPTTAGTIRVPADQPTIQAGIDAAALGDTVLVAPGTWAGPGNKALDFGGKAMTLLSEDGPALTIIDCEADGRAFYFHSWEDSLTIVSGFSIWRGSADRGGGVYCTTSSPKLHDMVMADCVADERGGGAYCYLQAYPIISKVTFLRNRALSGGGAYLEFHASARLREATFQDNESSSWSSLGGGGGLYCEYSSPSLADCEFMGNSARERGGAMRCYDHSNPTLRRVNFTGNTTGMSGGALQAYRSSSPSLSDVTFFKNSADNDGGGMDQWGGAAALNDVLFSENSADDGGGMSIRDASPALVNVTFADNVADVGGGLWCDEAAAVLDRCVFVGNHATTSAGALRVIGLFKGYAEGPTITNCTFVLNSSSGYAGGIAWSGVYWSSLTHSIVAFSTQGEGLFCDGESIPVITRCCIFGNEGGDEACGDHYDNFSENPMLCGLADRDLTLCEESPCAPAGNVWQELIGALDVGCSGCGSSVTAGSWGRIKAMYR